MVDFIKRGFFALGGLAGPVAVLGMLAVVLLWAFQTEVNQNELEEEITKLENEIESIKTSKVDLSVLAETLVREQQPILQGMRGPPGVDAVAPSARSVADQILENHLDQLLTALSERLETNEVNSAKDLTDKELDELAKVIVNRHRDMLVEAVVSSVEKESRFKTAFDSANELFSSEYFSFDFVSSRQWEDRSGSTITTKVRNISSRDLRIGFIKWDNAFATSDAGDRLEVEIEGLGSRSLSVGHASNYIPLSPGGETVVVFRVNTPRRTTIIGESIFIRGSVTYNFGNSNDNKEVSFELAGLPVSDSN